MLWLITASQTR